MSFREWLNAPVGNWARKREGKVLMPLARSMKQLRVTPNMLTVGGLALQGVVALLLANGHTALGGWVLLVAGLFDILDGALARLMGQETRLGAFLDSMFDQCGDVIVFLGLLWPYLNAGVRVEVVLVFVALFGSMLNSHARSRAGMLGIECRAGLMTRGERYPIMITGLIFHQATLMLWLLVVLNNFSAVQRIVYVWRTVTRDDAEKKQSENQMTLMG